jgi:hypothetical protein
MSKQPPVGEPVISWNWGRKSSLSDDTRHDVDWYKRPSSKQNVLQGPADSHPPHWCYLTNREERVAKFQKQYLDYVARFERWDRRKGWMRYFARQPFQALRALCTAKPLPDTWRRQPMDEGEFYFKRFMRAVGKASD